MTTDSMNTCDVSAGILLILTWPTTPRPRAPVCLDSRTR